MFEFDFEELGDDGAAEAEARAAQEKAARADAFTSSLVRQSFSRDRAISLQTELYEAFEDDGFQQSLSRLKARCERGEIKKAQFLKERQSLFLTVQEKVLPKYGFEGSLEGVHHMMGDMKPYIRDQEFIDLAEGINVLIGINYSPPESWNELSESCQKVDAPAPKARSGGYAAESTGKSAGAAGHAEGIAQRAQRKNMAMRFSHLKARHGLKPSEELVDSD